MDFLGWLKDILASLLFLIFPFGFGTFLFWVSGSYKIISRESGAIATSMISIGAGWTVLTILFIYAESAVQTANLLSYGMPILALAAVVGVVVGRREIINGFHHARPTEKWDVGLTLLVIAFVYYYRFIHFSSYPLRDVFQDVHFMKGATELARFGILNPFTADSYIPLLQVHWGLLAKFLNVDLLRLQWILPFVVLVFHYFALKLFFESMGLSERVQRYGLILSLIVMKFIFSWANNDLVISLVLLAFYLFYQFNRVAEKPERYYLVPLAIVASLLISKYLSPVLYVLLAFGISSGIWLFSKSRAIKIANVLFLVFVFALALHRASYMFIPVSYVVYLIYCWFSESKRSTSDTLKTIFKIALLSYSAFSVGLLLRWYLRKIGSPFIPHLKTYSVNLFLNLIGKSSLNNSGELTSSSYTNTLIEWLRTSIPALHVVGVALICGLFLWWRLDRKTFTPIQETSKALGAIVNIVLATALTFSGIPFIYRGQFFSVLFHIVLISILFHWSLKSELLQKRTVRFLFGIGIAVFAFRSAIIFYNFQYDYTKIPNAYLSRLFPLSHLLLITLFLLALYTFFSKTYRGSIAIGLIIVTFVSHDMMSMTTKFGEYSYGSFFPEPRIISHYNLDDLGLAKRAAKLPHGSILVSDPYTLSILRAVTGFNSFYIYANIAELDSERAGLMKDLLKAVVQNPLAVPNKVDTALVTNPWIGAESRYVFEREYKTSAYRFDTIKENLYFVISERTYTWLDGLIQYFPNDRKLTAEHFAHLNENFKVVFCYGNHACVVQVK